jgi:hypothetical protein
MLAQLAHTELREVAFCAHGTQGSTGLESILAAHFSLAIVRATCAGDDNNNESSDSGTERREEHSPRLMQV